MKLLFDQNLSPRLTSLLADIYADSIHVETVGLERASDSEVWNYCKTNALTVVSKDVDFTELSLLYGFPPQVVWIVSGNCSTSSIEKILRQYQNIITTFCEERKEGVLTLY